MSNDDSTFILTAALDPQSQAWLDELREKHFPRERNVLKAHLTLFHRLSPTHKSLLEAATLPDAPLPIRFDPLRLLGYGVAVDVECTPLLRLREQFISVIGSEITKQDQQKFRPHVTIQNKVEANVARELYEILRADFVPREGALIGLQFWRYLSGPWELVSQNWFASQAPK